MTSNTLRSPFGIENLYSPTNAVNQLKEKGETLDTLEETFESDIRRYKTALGKQNKALAVLYTGIQNGAITDKEMQELESMVAEQATELTTTRFRAEVAIFAAVPRTGLPENPPLNHVRLYRGVSGGFDSKKQAGNAFWSPSPAIALDYTTKNGEVVVCDVPYEEIHTIPNAMLGSNLEVQIPNPEATTTQKVIVRYGKLIAENGQLPKQRSRVETAIRTFLDRTSRAQRQYVKIENPYDDLAV